MTPAHVVKGFGALRTGLGVAFLVAPRKLSGGDDLLMTRSFAVRELVLGVAALRSPRTQDWARVGALVDVGDAAIAAVARQRVPLVVALTGLFVEAWAARTPRATGSGLAATAGGARRRRASGT